MMFKHRLRPNHANYGPTTHIMVDCEARRTPLAEGIAGHTRTALDLRCWCAERVDFRRDSVRNKRQAQGKTPADFWDWFRKQLHKSRQTWLWAHNAQVDLTWLATWPNIDAGHIVYHTGVWSCPPFMLHLSIDGLKFHCVDSLNWWKCPLAHLGQDLRLEKLPQPAEDATEEAWFTYCARDVEILSRTVQNCVQLIRRNDLGLLRKTVGSQAYGSWRHIHKEPLPWFHGDEDLAKFERSAYFAGQNWIGYQGCVRAHNCPPHERRKWEKEHGRTLWATSIHVLDVRGFYPFAMKRFKYPYKYKAKYLRPTTAQAREIAMTGECIAWVKVNSKDSLYPYRSDDGVIWATGSFWTVLAGEELRWAWNNGHIQQAGPMVEYHAADLFSKWVDKVWNLRHAAEQSGNLAQAAMLKDLSVSLHGKLGQRARKWSRTSEVDPPYRWGEWLTPAVGDVPAGVFRAIAGLVEHKEPEEEHHQAFVSIPVMVTANARVLMREVMAELPPRTILHHNTDSLHVTAKGYSILLAKGWIGHDRLGDLRRQRVALEAEYLSPSTYRLEDDVTIAGIPRQRAQKDTWQFEWEQWESLRCRLQRGPATDVRVETRGAQLLPDDYPVDTDRDGWVKFPRIDNDLIPF